jgi:hypothetical protein
VRPIVIKYWEGKMKRTLKRELNEYLKLLKGNEIKLIILKKILINYFKNN